MLFSMQPHACIGIQDASSLLPDMIHYDSTNHSYSHLSPSTVLVCIEATLGMKAGMTPVQKDDIAKNSTAPIRQRSDHVSASFPSPALNAVRRANARFQETLKINSARWTEGYEVDSETTSNNKGTIQDSTPAATSEDNEDVFGTTAPRRSRAWTIDLKSCKLQDPIEFDEDELAGQSESDDFSPTNDTQFSPPDPQDQDPPLSQSIPPRAVNIVKCIGPSSSRRDPRHLFGSQETHLPWIKKLSPNTFTQTIHPKMLPRDSPPAKSMWEAEEDEFDRWPTVAQAREELNTARKNATLKRNTFVKPQEPELSIAEQITDAINTPMGETDRTTHEQEQLILELEDMECGNPWGRDRHDDVVAPFRSHAYTALPVNASARHMHVLDAELYLSSKDVVIKAARPRLCDAVATVLAYTSVACLEAFLDPKVEVFEWRRLGNCVMIRREGDEVLVGNYYNFGTTYQWGYLVRSTIGADGAWSENYASVSQGTTPVTKERIRFEDFAAEGGTWNVEPDNEEFALHMGRQLAEFLLRWSVWDYNKWWRYKVEWESDGKVTNARDRSRYPAGLLE